MKKRVRKPKKRKPVRARVKEDQAETSEDLRRNAEARAAGFESFEELEAWCEYGVELDARGPEAAAADDKESEAHGRGTNFDNVVDLDAYRAKATRRSGVRTAAEHAARDDWMRGLVLTQKGGVRQSTANVMHILSQHPDWRELLAYNDFARRVECPREPPMRAQDRPENYSPGPWSDDDTTRTAAWICQCAGFEPRPAMVRDAVHAIAQRRIINPLRDWLQGLQWDGVKRLDGMLSEYFGAAANGYVRAVGARWMISAVARVMSPGCKVDSVLVLEGDQGTFKSSAMRKLAGAQWFSDSPLEIGNKEGMAALGCVWIHELSELAALKGRETERIKAFLSSQVDHYRPVWAASYVDFPRQTVFVATTNDSAYLHDTTGARRFWPVRCGVIDLAGLERDREQLWAEAVVRYRAGEHWYLDTADLVGAQQREAERRRESDPWEEQIAELVARKPGRPLTVAYILGALDVPPHQQNPAASQRVGRIMKKLGFVRVQRTIEKGRPKRWVYLSPGDQGVPGDAPGDAQAVESRAEDRSGTTFTTYSRRKKRRDSGTTKKKTGPRHKGSAPAGDPGDPGDGGPR